MSTDPLTRQRSSNQADRLPIGLHSGLNSMRHRCSSIRLNGEWGFHARVLCLVRTLNAFILCIVGFLNISIRIHCDGDGDGDVRMRHSTSLVAGRRCCWRMHFVRACALHYFWYVTFGEHGVGKPARCCVCGKHDIRILSRGLCFNQDSTTVFIFVGCRWRRRRRRRTAAAERRQQRIDSCHFQLNIDPRVVFIKFYYSARARVCVRTKPTQPRSHTHIPIWSFINL